MHTMVNNKRHCSLVIHWMLRITRTAFLFATIVGSDRNAVAQTSALVSIRSEQSGLPQSIRRETFAAIDHSRQSLLDMRDEDHIWTLEDGSQTVFPVLALCDPFPETYVKAVGDALRFSTQRLVVDRSQPWTPDIAAETTYTALAGRMNAGQHVLDAHLLTRLSRVKLSSLPPTDAALLLIALEYHKITVDGGWPAIINTIRRKQNPDPCDVAIAALGRLKCTSSGADKLGDDVLAHVRWLAKHLSLQGNTANVATPDLLTPETAYFITVLASHLPRQILARDPSLFPYNWRNVTANRLIAQQRFDYKTGRHYWRASSPTGSDLKTSTYAIMTLVLLAE